jgi:hypothetical protein
MEFLKNFWRTLRRNPIVLIIVGIAAIGLSAYPFFYYSTEKTETITVKNKERVNYEKSSKYLIYTESNRVFENTDSALYGKFNSSNIYARLEAGNCYRVKTAGIRFSLVSSYRNIIEIEGTC